MNKNMIILGLSLVVAGMILAFLFRPAPQSVTGDLTQDQELEIQRELVILKDKYDSLNSELSRREEIDTIQKKVHEKATLPIKKTISKLERDPEVIKTRDSLPKIDSLLRAKDSLHIADQKQIKRLELSARVTKEINDNLKENLQTRLSETQKLLAEEQLENEELTKENKKLRRKITVNKVGGLILISGIVYLAIDR